MTNSTQISLFNTGKTLSEIIALHYNFILGS